MSKLEKMNAQALDAGVSPLAEIRAEAIAQRDDALGKGRMHAAVFWTHLVWWLSVVDELLEAETT